jgi:hypothetical protein
MSYQQTTYYRQTQMRNEAAQMRQEAAEQRQYTEALEAPIPTGYAHIMLRECYGDIIADFQYFAPMNIITRRAPLGTPRATLLAQLAQGGAA